MGDPRKLSGQGEALLAATACSGPPEGRKRWTLTLLADVIVRLMEHDELSREAVRRRLAENTLKPRRRGVWCVPKVEGSYEACMFGGGGLHDVQFAEQRWIRKLRSVTIGLNGNSGGQPI